jgi:4-amino-4-deoxy-L-arabinose transferase-like glycosyltransferase
MKRPLLFLLFVAFLPLAGFWSYGLFDLDEGFYGSITSEMNRRGEWITPYFNGNPWFEKPILVYWLAKPALWLFGVDFGPRLPAILAALAMTAAVFQFVRKHHGEQAAMFSGIILSSSILWAAVGRMIMTDTLLAASIAMAWFALWEHGGKPRKMLEAGVWTGLAVLAKGPIGLILVGLAAVVACALIDDRRKAWLRGIPLFLLATVAVVSLWYLPAYLANGQLFVQKFLIEQNLNRFQGGDAAHTIKGFGNYIFFVPILLLGFAPWSFYLWKAWPRKDGDSMRKFFAIAAAVPFIFFTVSSAKLVHYILPCFVPLSIIVGTYFAPANKPLDLRALRPALIWVGFVTVLINAGLPIYYQTSGHAEIHTLARSVTPNETVIAYQMPRRNQDRGTGRPKLQETSHPSLALYVNRVVLEAEELRAESGKLFWRKNPEDAWQEVALPAVLLTRADRIPNPDAFLVGGIRLEGGPQDNYARYEIRSTMP